MKTSGEKSQSVDLSLYAAVFKDITAYDGSLQEILGVYLDYLVHIVDTRGMSFVMIDMPDVGKLFDKGLSSGQFCFEEIPHTFGRTSEQSCFRFFLRDLFVRTGFDDSTGKMNPDVIPDPNLVFFVRQILYMGKKIKRPCSDERIRVAVADFISIEENLRSPSLNWHEGGTLQPVGVHRLPGLGRPGTARQSSTISFLNEVEEYSTSYRDLRRLQRVSDMVANMLPWLDYRDVLPKHGPGAVSDLLRWEDKYVFPYWPAKLETEFPFTYFTEPDGGQQYELFGNVPLRDEPAARLIAVPKTLKGPRLIASEPVAHQFIQQGLMKWLRDHLPKPLRLSIDFLSQNPSRDLALKSSMDGEYVTVDLSSASDRLSLWTVERVFRKRIDVLRALHASRSRYIDVSMGGKSPQKILMRKFAPQGSGVTFPVQTVVYAILALTAVWLSEDCDEYHREVKSSRMTISKLARLARKVRVFGDDIIIPKSADWYLRGLLQHMQLKVNESKTHSEGHFRESCGMDAFHGTDVSPCYVSSLTLGGNASDLVSWIDVSNNAYRAGLWNLAETMVLSLPEKVRKRLPVTQAETGCLTLFTYGHNSQYPRARYNRSLMRWEVKGLVPKTKVVAEQREGSHALLHHFLQRHRVDGERREYLLTLYPSLSSDPSKWHATSSVIVKTGWVPVRLS